MNTNAKPSLIIAILACTIFTITLTVETEHNAVATAPPQAAGPASGDIIQAIDAVHAAALQADVAAKSQLADQTGNESKLMVGNWDLSSSRVLAIGAGVVLGVMAFNFITSGSVITPSLTSAVSSVGAGATANAARTATTGALRIATSTASGTIVSVYALVGAAVGGLTGNHLYNAMQQPTVAKPDL